MNPKSIISNYITIDLQESFTHDRKYNLTTSDVFTLIRNVVFTYLSDIENRNMVWYSRDLAYRLNNALGTEHGYFDDLLFYVKEAKERLELSSQSETFNVDIQYCLDYGEGEYIGQPYFAGVDPATDNSDLTTVTVTSSSEPYESYLSEFKEDSSIQDYMKEWMKITQIQNYFGGNIRKA